jgi:DUF2905 family protein
LEATVPGGFAFQIGRALVILGVVTVLIGLILMAGEKFSFLGLGRLPGDFSFRGKNFSFYFPLATSVIISFLLTGILWLISLLTRK